MKGLLEDRRAEQQSDATADEIEPVLDREWELRELAHRCGRVLEQLPDANAIYPPGHWLG